MRRGDGEHGDRFHYVSPNPDTLGWILERAIGIHGQWIYVDPAARLTMIKLSSQPIPADDHLDELDLDIFRSIGKAVRAE